MIKLTLTADRKLVGIAADNFTIALNGLDNAAYRAALAPLGIELIFTAIAEELITGIQTPATETTAEKD